MCIRDRYYEIQFLFGQFVRLLRCYFRLVHKFFDFFKQFPTQLVGIFILLFNNTLYDKLFGGILISFSRLVTSLLLRTIWMQGYNICTHYEVWGASFALKRRYLYISYSFVSIFRFYLTNSGLKLSSRLLLKRAAQISFAFKNPWWHKIKIIWFLCIYLWLNVFHDGLF